MYHPRIVHLCNVKEVSPSKRLNSKALIYLFYLFLSWFHNRKSTPYHPQAMAKWSLQTKFLRASSPKLSMYTEEIGQRGFLKPCGLIELHGGIQQDILPMNLFMGKKSCSPLNFKSRLLRWQFSWG